MIIKWKNWTCQLVMPLTKHDEDVRPVKPVVKVRAILPVACDLSDSLSLSKINDSGGRCDRWKTPQLLNLLRPRGVQIDNQRQSALCILLTDLQEHRCQSGCT